MCNCIKEMNEQLESIGANTALDTKAFFDVKTGRQTRIMPTMATVKANPKIRKPKNIVLPTYCPFCGKKYE